MYIENIVNYVNDLLAGEQLTYSQLIVHLDSVIDDINDTLSTVFPAFSELPEEEIEYYAIPDNYIRSVICMGTAMKFYQTDEEGIQTAQAYEQRYRTALFNMLRDFSCLIPDEFLKETTGATIKWRCSPHNDMRGWF